MNIHEYQAKELLRQMGINTLRGVLCQNANEAQAAAEKLGGKVWVVKAQVHAGGRGKGGGIKLAKSPAEARDFTQKMLGMKLVTPQTGEEGKIVHKVYIEEGCDIDREIYAAVLLDRETSSIVIMASGAGGMDIEEVAEKQPHLLHKVFIRPSEGVSDFHGRKLAYGLGLKGTAAQAASQVFVKLYHLYTKYDCSLVEVNPLVVTKDNKVIPLDCKINFDANALYRHKDVLEMRDLLEEDPNEVEASKFDLAYIKLDGNIGCLVNGAGLAMATLDIIKFYGGEPANFLDVGGGASKEKVKEAFKIILNDPKVKGILVNIFGGIMKCDIIAEGVIAACKDVGIEAPLVVRLQGTNVEEGKRLLNTSGLKIITADDLNDAAKKIIAATGGGR